MGTEKVFQTKPIFKVLIGVVGFVGAFAGAALTGGKVHMAMPVAVAIVLGLMIGQKITISDTEMILKQGFKTLRFPFGESTFRVETRHGMASYLSSFRAESYLLHVAVPGKKESKIAFMLTPKDAEELMATLREKTAVATV